MSAPRAGADVLACQTLPAAAEVEALLPELEALDVPAWVSLTTVVDACGVVRTRRGEPAAEVFAMAADAPWVIATGVDCLDPRDVTASVRTAASGGKRVVAYPNSGERWDGVHRAWTGSDTPTWSEVDDWTAAGARLLGGCCRVGPERRAELTDRRGG